MQNEIYYSKCLTFFSCQSIKHEEMLYEAKNDFLSGKCFYSAKHSKEFYYTKYESHRIVELIETQFVKVDVDYRDSLEYEIGKGVL